MTKGGCCLNGIGLGWGMDRCGGSEGSSGIGIGLHSIVVGCGRVGRVDGRGRGGGRLGDQCRGKMGGGGVWRGLVHLEWKSKETSLLVCGLWWWCTPTVPEMHCGCSQVFLVTGWAGRWVVGGLGQSLVSESDLLVQKEGASSCPR